MTPDKLQTLYENLKKDGYDLPDYNTFKADMSDGKKLSTLHSNLLKEGYDLPDFNQFEADMGFKKKDLSSASPSQQMVSESPASDSTLPPVENKVKQYSTTTGLKEEDIQSAFDDFSGQSDDYVLSKAKEKSENPLEYNKSKAANKWKSVLQKSVSERMLNNGILDADAKASEYVNTLGVSGEFTPGTKYSDKKKRILTIRDEINNNVLNDKDRREAFDAFKVDAQAAIFEGLKEPEVVQKWNSSGDPLIGMGIELLELTDPTRAKNFQERLNNTQASDGAKQLTRKELEDAGINALLFEANRALGRPQTEDNLQKINAWIDYAKNKKNTQISRYPEAVGAEVDKLLLDLTEGLESPGRTAAFNFAQGLVGGPIDYIERAIDGLFKTKEERLAKDMEKDVAKSMTEDLISYSDIDRELDPRPVIPQLKDKSKLDAVMNDKSLSREQKYEKAYELVKNAYINGGIEYVDNPRFGSLNLSGKTLLHLASTSGARSFGNMTAAIASGGGTLGMMSAAFLDAADSKYAEAFASGDNNPFQESVKSGFINAALAPVFDEAATLKRAFSGAPRTALTSTPKSAIVDAAGNLVKESAEELTVEALDRGTLEDWKQVLIGTAVAAGPVVALSSAVQSKVDRDGYKLMWLEAGINPSQAKAGLQKLVQDGSISQQQLTDASAKVDKISQIVATMPKVDKNGKPLTDLQKATYAVNELKKQEAKAMSSTLPSKQAEEMKAVAEQADQKNAEILDGLSQNNTGKTQGFFTDVVEGVSDKYKPKKDWEPIMQFSEKEQQFNEDYKSFKGNFDTHIATSIPGFRDVQVKKGVAIESILPKDGLMYDIGGSEGGLVKTITKRTGARTINLDVNESMKAAHEKNPVPGSEFVNEAFLEPYEEDGKVYPAHKPKEKADVVHESMVFQFISPERAQFVKEVKDNYLKDDGVLILEEKVVPDSEKEWMDNEKRKDEKFKSKYYETQQLDQKREEVLTGMKNNQTMDRDLVAELEKNFKYVAQYWDSGNFKGYIASNDLSKIEKFMSEIGDTKSEFSTRETGMVDTDNAFRNNLPESQFKSQQEFEQFIGNEEFAMLTAQNPDAIKLSAKENAELNKKAEQWLTARGLSFTPIFGKYGNTERSYFVPGMTKEQSLEFAKEFNQDSVAHSTGLIFKDGTVAPRQAGLKIGPAEDNFSTINVAGNNIDFSIDYGNVPLVQELMDELGMSDAKSNIATALEGTGVRVLELSGEDFSAKAKSAGAQENDIAFFDPATGEIVLNKETADNITAIHEGAHPVMNIVYNTNRELYNQVVSGMKKLSGNKGIAKALAFGRQYEGQAVQDNEALVEAIAMIGDGQIDINSIPTSLKQRVIDLINMIGKMFGFQISDTDVKAFKDLASKVAESLRTGENIATIVGEENVANWGNDIPQKRLREGEPKVGFNSDKVARERFDIPNLERIGGGSDRDVFDLGDGNVLKVAKTARGLAQNNAENDWYLSSSGLLPEVIESGSNYVVSKKADSPVGNKDLNKMLSELKGFTQNDFDNKIGELQDVLAKYGLEDVLSYDVIWNDFTAKRNWGVIDGEPIHVDGGTFAGVGMLEDYRGVKNMEDADFRDVRNRSKDAKKRFGDKDKFTQFRKNSPEISGDPTADVTLEDLGVNTSMSSKQIAEKMVQFGGVFQPIWERIAKFKNLDELKIQDISALYEEFGQQAMDSAGGFISKTEREIPENLRGSIFISPEATGSVRNQYYTITHEFMHWVTIDSLPKAKDTESYKTLEKIYDFLNKNVDTQGYRTFQTYGLSNMNEFLAELLISNNFRTYVEGVMATNDQLKSVNNDQKDLITLLVELLKDVYAKVFGKDADIIDENRPLIDQASEIAVNLFFKAPVQARKSALENTREFKLAAFVMRKKGQVPDAEIAMAIVSVMPGMSPQEIKNLIDNPDQYIRDKFSYLTPLLQDNLIGRARVQNVYAPGSKSVDPAFNSLTVDIDYIRNAAKEKSLKDKIYGTGKQFVNKWLSPAKGLPKWVLALKDISAGGKNLDIQRAVNITQNLKKTAESIGFKDWDLFSAALKTKLPTIQMSTGTAIKQWFANGPMGYAQPAVMQLPSVFQQLPDEIIPYVWEMRGVIDGLTRDLVGSGYVTPEQAVTLESNIGAYTNRAYKLFNERGYKASKEDINNAIKFLADQYIKELATQNAGALTFEEVRDLAVDKAKKEVDDILDKKEGRFTVREDKRDTGILKERKEIPEPIRKLMGEYTDPGTVFIMTVAKQASLKAASEYLTGLRNMGMGSIIFEKNDPNRPAGTVEIVSEGSDVLSPLNGLYATPEVYDALQTVAPTMNDITNAWMKVVGAVRWGKTVGSVVTQIKNFESNLGFAVMNGLIYTGDNAKSFQGAAKYFKGILTGKEIDEVTAKAITLGLVGQGVSATELKQMLGSGDIHNIAVDKAVAGKGPNWIVKGVTGLNKLYQLNDDFWKVYAYINERELLSGAMFDKKYDQLTPEEQGDVDIEASERVKNTWPTYSRVWEGAKVLGKNVPIFGNFISFQAESVRVLSNTIKLAIQDLKNPQFRILGARRLAGAMSYIGLRSLITYTAANAAGLAAKGIMGAFGDDDEEQKKEGLNKALPAFMRTGDLMPIQNKKEPWKYTVFNLSSIDPYNVVFNSMNAFTDGNESTEAGAVAAGAEFLSGLLEPEMTFEAAWGIVQNRNPRTGDEITKDSDDFTDRMLKRGSYLFDMLQPSTIGFVKRLAGDNPQAEGAAAFGMRPYDVDLHKSFTIIMANTGKKLEEVNKEYFRVLYNSKSTAEDKVKAKKEAEDRVKYYSGKLSDTYRQFLMLGADKKELDKIIKTRKAVKMSGWTDAVKRTIVTGKIQKNYLK